MIQRTIIQTKGKAFKRMLFLLCIKPFLPVILVVQLGLFMPCFLSAQFFELGGFGGVASFNGDVNTNNIIANTDAAFGAFLRYTPHPNVAFRLNFVKGNLIANDRQSDHSNIKERNFNFKSDLYEFSFLTEWNILPIYPWNNQQVFSPYIGLGVAVFMFNPMTKYQGEWLALQPLGTEGQGLNGYEQPYALRQLALPLTAGIKYVIGQRFCIGLEFGYRFTFTDYIDDVSGVYLSPTILQTNGTLAVALANRTEEYTGLPADDKIGSRRGNSNTNDAYIIWGLSLSVNIGTQKPKARNKKQEYQLNRWI
jgi:hypothetical protein